MSNIIGSEFELYLRILLILEASDNKSLTEGAIAALDHIIVYARDFDMAEYNLHGSNKYRFGELASRRATVKVSLKKLVLDRLVSVENTSNGFMYSLSENGRDFSAELDTGYADAYCSIAAKVIAELGVSEHKLGRIINQKTITLIREG